MGRQSSMADDSIDSHVLWAMGAGAIPLPILDVAAVTAIQLNMFKELCMIYQVDYNESFAKNLISSIAGATLARIGASFIKAIPGIGTLLGSVPMVVLSGASTYAIGQVFKQHLEIGGMMSSFSFENAQKIYNDAFERGKSYVDDLRKRAMGETKKEEKADNTPKEEPPKAASTQSSNTSDAFEKLKILADLKAQGILTEEEFQQKKAKLLEEI
ncbi:MAG: SHOCT domain-containing protein [Microscillaceae bacterium]|nr:SHOCT domain-containing protein [Microscillaceae bacterium]